VSPSAASGSVQFFDGTTLLGTANLAAGSAIFSTQTLSTGSHSIQAVYVGNSTYGSSTSATLSETID
jgi:hypothetical protein